MFRVGQKYGEYQIVAQLRTGGMATLLLGERTGAAGFARRVAIKVVHPHLAADARFVQMLIDEALLAARIQHPNVVHVEQLGEVDGTHFLAMEYVHGGSLAELLRALEGRGFRLSPQLAVWIALQIADGLHAAHETRGDAGELLGVVHRDVSPQNVLLSFTGQVKVIDFGIAKARGRGLQTDVGGIKGKLPYMAPEQASGRLVDRRADVYALGVVLWEMLTRRRLFDAEDYFELLETVRHPRVPAPSRVAPDVPPALDAAVLAALAPDPTTRPQTALEFRQRLAEALPAALALESSHLARLMASALECSDAEVELERLPLASLLGTAVETAPDAAPPAAALDSAADALAAIFQPPRAGEVTAAGAPPGAPAAVSEPGPADAPAQPPTPLSALASPPRAATHGRAPRWHQLAVLTLATTVGAAGAWAMARRDARDGAVAPSHARGPAALTTPAPATPAPRDTAATTAAQPVAAATTPPTPTTGASAPPTGDASPRRRAHRPRRRARSGPQYVDGLPLVGEP